MTTANILSSPASEERLIRVPLDHIYPHPANANLMTPERREKLRRNIQRQGKYPPLVVRPHPTISNAHQLLDGHQRCEVLIEMGETEALCFPWPCDDATALILLGTLNRLEGEDIPVKRAELLAELTGLLSAEELSLLLPEDAGAIQQTLALLDLDTEKLLAQLTAAAAGGHSPHVISFAVSDEEERVIEGAIARASDSLTGQNKRGRALATVCRRFLEGTDA